MMLPERCCKSFEFLGYDPKMKNASFVKETIMSITRLDACVATVVRCSVRTKSVEDMHRNSAATRT